MTALPAKRTRARPVLLGLFVAVAAGLVTAAGAQALDPHDELEHRLAALGTPPGFDPRSARYSENGDVGCIFECPRVGLRVKGPEMSEARCSLPSTGTSRTRATRR